MRAKKWADGRQTIAPLEAWSSLSVNGEKYIKIIYTSGKGVKDKSGKLIDTPATFSRRCYWFKHKPQYMLIHYLDTGPEAQHRIRASNTDTSNNIMSLVILSKEDPPEQPPNVQTVIPRARGGKLNRLSASIRNGQNNINLLKFFSKKSVKPPVPSLQRDYLTSKLNGMNCSTNLP